MHPSNRARSANVRSVQALVALALAGSALLLMATPTRAALTIGNNPLYMVKGKANVLITLDNSNSMDEDATGAAVGSNSANSKSEIARTVVRGLTDTYRNRVNMGLMAYRQNAPTTSYLHNSQYDGSFDGRAVSSGGNWDPNWSGSRAAKTKKYRVNNPASAGNHIAFNVALPFYSVAPLGNAFCYSNTANAAVSASFPNGFNNGENAASGPWDNYRCFTVKTGISDTLPVWGNATSESASGFSSFWFGSSFNPTDSDFAQGILDFGRFLTWQYVGPTWFVNNSPGRGYLHIPLGDLNTAKADAIKAALACNVPGNPAPCTAAGIKNAGLTPIEGTLLTARDYYKGTWNTAAEGYTASCYPLPTSCGKNFVVLLTDGLPSTSASGTALSNPATALAAAAAAAAALKAEGVETYVIGFALPYGTDASTLNQIAIAGGTDVAYSASTQASLQAAFNAIFEDIERKTSAFGAVSQNSTSIDTGSLVFQGRFSSTDWSGEVLAMRPDNVGGLTQVWSTNTDGSIPAADVRKVFTLKPGVGGVAFKVLGDLSALQAAALSSPNCSPAVTGATCGQARIDWIRGDRTLESGNPEVLRRRSKVMGDIISSSPFYVKATNTVFVGSNDGMLHAINAANGIEHFAFVPNAVIASLPLLTATSYSHSYFVDGDITVSSTVETPGRNILVGALGRGGKGLYALDVSNPAAFDASKVMWEFPNAATDPADVADIGLMLGRPVIVKLNTGQTAVVVGNGYNSTRERAVLFVIDINTGAVIRKIDTGAGSSSDTNGLASPRGWDSDGSGTVDVIYAGDLLGNLWKFDMSSATKTSWDTSHRVSGNPAPLFVATNAAGTVRQPITGMIGVGMNYRKGSLNFGKRFVFFGTGRYITTTDVTSTATQSWYGLIDDDTTTIARSDLTLRSIAEEGTASGSSVRAFSAAVSGDMTAKRGWVVDMLSLAGTGGERFLGEHKFFGTVLVASSMIPRDNTCEPGGEGYINAIDPFTGAALSASFFGVNNAASFTPLEPLGAARRPVGSVRPNINIPSDALLIGNRLVSSGTSGQLKSLSVNNPIRNGRITWREVVSR